MQRDTKIRSSKLVKCLYGETKNEALSVDRAQLNLKRKTGTEIYRVQISYSKIPERNFKQSATYWQRRVIILGCVRSGRARRRRWQW